MTQTQDIASYRGQNLHGSGGEKIGTVEEIYLDTETNQPEWALVNTGLFGTKRSFVPLHDASPGDDGVSVPFDKATVKDAPQVDPDGQLSQREEAELYRHYGLEYSEARSGSGLPDSGDGGGDAVGGAVSGPPTHDALSPSGASACASTW